MRKSALLIFALLGLAAAVGFLSWRAPGGISPEAPPQIAAEAAGAPAPESVILFNAHIALADLQRIANAQAPLSQSGAEADPAPDPLKDDEAHWRLDRSEIIVSAHGGALVMQAPVTGVVAISGALKLLVKVKLKAEGVVAGLITATARPALSADWRVRPGLQLAADIAQADVALEGLGSVSVKGLIRRDAEKLITGLGARLDADLAQDDFLEKAARGVWDDLCGLHPFTIDGEAAALALEPGAFMASRPVVTDDGVAFALGLRARARVTQGDAPAIACGPLPALRLAPAPPVGGFSLAAPISVGWQTASRLASGELAKKPLFGAADGLARAVATRITLMPHGMRVLARLDFTATTSGWLGEASWDGFVFATALPVFNAETAKLRFDDVELTAESGAALGGRSALSSWLVGLIGAPEISFAKLIARAQRKAEKALESLKARLPGIDAAATKIEAFAILGAAVRQDGIEVMAAARGRAEAEILNLDFAQ